MATTLDLQPDAPRGTLVPERDLLAADPSIDYCAVGERLAMPVGSIGPTRARGLARLREHPELQAFCPRR